MPLRLICLLLSWCLLWPAAAAGDTAVPGPSVPVAAAVADADPQETLNAAAAAVLDHHLDDRPAPAHADPAAEGIALLPPALRHLAATAPDRPLTEPHRPGPTPYLEGLQRPPCGARTSA